MHTDLQLLSRYHQRGDALAFRDLMQAHAGMVLATARRVTGNAVMAEDVAQETFLQLARQSQHITESVAAWLHRVAWRRACNAVRADATRRRHEDAAVVDAATMAPGHGEASWAEVEAVLDTVIDELPDDLREPLVMHFLQGRSQREIARELRVSQSTVSRAVESGLTELRGRLKAKGLLCSAGLGVMIATHSAAASAAVPASLLASLGKLGMSGIGGASVGATEAAAGLSLGSVLKLGMGLSVLLLLGGVLVWNSSRQETPAGVSTRAARQSPTTKPVMLKDRPKPAEVGRYPMTAAAPPPVAPPAVAAGGRALPVHELVHSFPVPPRHPGGHLVRDAEGWLWGITTAGGNYGLGTIYKMREDGSEWQEIVSFNGTQGTPRGAHPQGGLTPGKDGYYWGTTTSGGIGGKATLYRLDPKRRTLTTMVDFPGNDGPWSRPTIAPDGQVWVATNAAVYRYNPATQQFANVFRLTGSAGAHPGRSIHGELTADDRGFFWGTASEGGAGGHGTVFKVNIATGAAATVVQFTGTAGAFPGRISRSGLTLDASGYLWGTTCHGGSADNGTVFKIHADSGNFTSVAEFDTRVNGSAGAVPDTMLTADGEGHLWGVTSYTANNGRGSGAIYKVNALTGKRTSVVAFTGIEGPAQGGPARGELLPDGAGGFFGASGFGGAGSAGTIYRVEIRTGKFTLLKDLSDLARTTEGEQPQGGLVAAADGWLWGVTDYGGAHHCGTIYKFNAVTNALVRVIDFTGSRGPHKGRLVRTGMTADGQGWLWGTTFSGGTNNGGTVFKVHERTGTFVTVAEFSPNSKDGVGTAPMSDLVADGRGCMWGATHSAIFKVNIRSHALTRIVKFTGDEGPNHGSMAPGTLALDDRGFLWGCALADYTHQRGSLFKIDTATDAFTTVENFTDANQGWPGWHPQGDMHWDGKGSMWFTGVPDQGGARATCALVKVNTRTSTIEARYRQNGFAMIAAPISDDHGVIWGTSTEGGRGGSIYTFDPATQQFTTALTFTGQGSQAKSGSQPQVTRLMKHSDGNFYAVTRYGGPGNGGTVFRLRYGPTPMTQEATLLADGRVSLHGTLTPNGLESDAAFEWGTEPTLTQATLLTAGRVPAGNAPRPVTATLSGLQAATTYYFRLRGANAANAIPQRGAVLNFTTPATKANTPAPALAANAESEGGSEPNQISADMLHGTRHALRINRVPGAGAGFVNGVLKGSAYEVGQRYALTAVGDNDYVFHHWSGTGIRGAQAEDARLSFVFTEELAKTPVITATFVRNPFRNDVIGSYHGLVYAAAHVTPDLSNTGAISLSVTHAGSFSGSLRYDGQAIPLTGAFDTGGLARFGPARESAGRLAWKGKPGVRLTLQMDLSATGPHEIHGMIDDVDGPEVVNRSVIKTARSPYDGRLRIVPAEYLINGGHQDLVIAGSDGNDTSGHLHLTPAGHATLSARLADGTGVLAQAPLSAANHAAFFAQLYVNRTGSIGGAVALKDLLPVGEPVDQLFWWGRPGWPALDTLRVRAPQVPPK